FKPDCRTGGDVEPHTVSNIALKLQSRIGFEKMEVRAHLNRPVAAIGHRHRGRPQSDIEFDVAGFNQHFAWDHGMPLMEYRSWNRMVDRDELGAVRESRFDLYVRDHFGDAIHHVGTRQDFGAV